MGVALPDKGTPFFVVGPPRCQAAAAPNPRTNHSHARSWHFAHDPRMHVALKYPESLPTTRRRRRLFCLQQQKEHSCSLQLCIRMDYSRSRVVSSSGLLTSFVVWCGILAVLTPGHLLVGVHAQARTAPERCLLDVQKNSMDYVVAGLVKMYASLVFSFVLVLSSRTSLTLPPLIPITHCMYHILTGSCGATRTPTSPRHPSTPATSSDTT